VDIYLQAYGCDPISCGWVTVASGSGDYYAGGGSGKRANARKACATTATVGWRGYVDVDLIGVSDPSGYATDPASISRALISPASHLLSGEFGRGTIRLSRMAGHEHAGHAVARR